MTVGFHHVALRYKGVSQLTEAVRFYRDILGMTEVRRWGEGDKTGVMLDAGEGDLIEMFADAGTALPGGVVTHFALCCGDVDGTVSRVRDAGFEIIMEPTDISIPSCPPLPARIAFCRGVGGEEIELFCEKN
ncbi:MAG: VOC family protein [Clostridia bacterium]|nr:VOC family protein [Clostridia bacterium]